MCHIVQTNTPQYSGPLSTILASFRCAANFDLNKTLLSRSGIGIMGLKYNEKFSGRYC